jgi:hypothetical protein
MAEESYYEWEKQLEAGSPNKIGLPEDLFKNFLKKWKKQNLKDVK